MKKLRKAVRGLYVKLVPAKTRAKLEEYAKGAIAASGGVLSVVNVALPDYSETATAIVGGAIAVLTFIGVVRVPNRKARRR
jgi:hypothetical protein